jgi:hypothetical protein
MIKYHLHFYLLFLILLVVDIYAIYEMSQVIIFLVNLFFTISSLLFFKIQKKDIPFRIELSAYISILCVGIADAAGLYREYQVYFFTAFFIGTIASASGFYYLSYFSDWRKKLESKLTFFIVLISLLSLFIIADKFALQYLPDFVFLPASILAILLTNIVMVSFLRDTSTKSYNYIITSSILLFILLIFSSHLPNKLTIPHSLFVSLVHEIFVVAKFFWVLGLTWALRNES